MSSALRHARRRSEPHRPRLASVPGVCVVNPQDSGWLSVEQAPDDSRQSAGSKPPITTEHIINQLMSLIPTVIEADDDQPG